MKTDYDIIIAGGGLAGLTAALELSSEGFSILLLERKKYPFHKVCGEYISNEVKSYLQSLKAFPAEHKPVSIDQLAISSKSGYITSCTMPLGGFGISRYTLDNHLYESCLKKGVEVLQCNVEHINFEEDHFTVRDASREWKSRIVLGAYGKRSKLDKSLHRRNSGKRSSYLAVKGHFKGDHNANVVSLHNFEGGYCGISTVEEQRINVCYLTRTDIFKKYKGIKEFQQKHLGHNPHLKKFFQEAEPLFEEPLTISQIDFDDKELVKDGVLMCGDAAGLIHPLCGNGMAMAIRAARLCSIQVTLFLKNEISRSDMEWNYRIRWEHLFQARLKYGKWLQNFFGKGLLTEAGLRVAGIHPFLLKQIIKLTHGKEIPQKT